MSNVDALKRAFFAGWARFDTSAPFDEERASGEFARWFGDQIAELSTKTQRQELPDELKHMLDKPARVDSLMMKAKRK